MYTLGIYFADERENWIRRMMNYRSSFLFYSIEQRYLYITRGVYAYPKFCVQGERERESTRHVEEGLFDGLIYERGPTLVPLLLSLWLLQNFFVLFLFLF